MDRSAKKKALCEKLLAALEAELERMRRAASDARAAATHEEAKPENDKDTRALEASYLAGAQAARAREIEGEIKMIAALPCLDLSSATARVQASAVVSVEDEDGEKTTYFVAPCGGGASLELDGEVLQVLTPQSPRGRLLLGRSVGDVVEAPGRLPSVRKELTIVALW